MDFSNQVSKSLTFCLFILSVNSEISSDTSSHPPSLDKSQNRLRRQTELVEYDKINDINTLGNGSCSYTDLTIGAQICDSLFFREIILNPNEDCSKLFRLLQECISSKWNECSKGVATMRHARSAQSELLYYVEAGYCNDGGLSLPNPSQPVNYCGIGYTRMMSKCIEKYHLHFRTDPSSNQLCYMYQEARQCINKAQDDYCTYPPMLKYIQNNTEALSRCWNPFCIWQHKSDEAELMKNKIDFIQIRQRIENILRQTHGTHSKVYLKYYTSSLSSKGVSNECTINRAGLLDLSVVGDPVYSTPPLQIKASVEVKQLERALQDESASVDRHKTRLRGKQLARNIARKFDNKDTVDVVGKSRHEASSMISVGNQNTGSKNVYRGNSSGHNKSIYVYFIVIVYLCIMYIT